VAARGLMDLSGEGLQRLTIGRKSATEVGTLNTWGQSPKGK